MRLRLSILSFFSLALTAVPLPASTIQFVIATYARFQGPAIDAYMDLQGPALGLPRPAPTDITYLTIRLTDWPAWSSDLTGRSIELEGSFLTPTLTLTKASPITTFRGSTAAGGYAVDTSFGFWPMVPAGTYEGSSMLAMLSDMKTNGYQFKFQQTVLMTATVGPPSIGAADWVNYGTVASYAEIPEPTTASLLVGALAVLLLARRRKR